ncbi:hypothetical protein CDL15_Pgr004468 [Punica granatum]|uniref:Uncharacterized protein n=1 Tax=Punica granatum TaxID=22663 RepID=A0A218XH24_PUNGR|nr:hypothetical protein CDL15_Pgr004468 [Punica granatum]
MALASPSATASRTSIISSSSSSSHSRPFGALSSPRSQKLRSFQSSSQFGLNCTSSPLSQPTHHSFIRSSSIASSPVTDVELPESSTASWEKFAENVSGEWDGFGADFTSQGQPIELPESVVPEAYREWEVKVFDWQTQCPTLAKPTEQVLQYRTIKLLPTVGCEADAATRYSIDERSIGDGSNKVEALAYQSSGCYVAVWPLESEGVARLIELEYCVVNPQDQESRVRISQVIGVKDDDAKMSLKGIKVFCEQWYGPFRNGEQLGGCAIRDSAFASTPSTKASDVIGVWEGPVSVATFHVSENNFLQELLGTGVQRSVRDEKKNLVLLPKQLWCSLQEQQNGETLSEVGWVFSHGQSITSSCTFSRDRKLKVIPQYQNTC